jgi:ketosteroid isomerase-like protein
MSTEGTLKHHMDALKGGDLDGIMEDYVEESVIIQGDNVVRGLEAIRGMFKGAVAAGFAGSIELKHQVSDGEIGYMVWSVPGMIPFGTDTFVIRDSKILVQTVALQTP